MAMYRIEIDHDSCVGDHLCCDLAPGTFRIGPDGKSDIADPDGDPPRYVLTAAKSCRLEAITLYDAQTAERVWPKR